MPVQAPVSQYPAHSLFSHLRWAALQFHKANPNYHSWASRNYSQFFSGCLKPFLLFSPFLDIIKWLLQNERVFDSPQKLHFSQCQEQSSHHRSSYVLRTSELLLQALPTTAHVTNYVYFLTVMASCLPLQISEQSHNISQTPDGEKRFCRMMGQERAVRTPRARLWEQKWHFVPVSLGARTHLLQST